MSHSHAFIKKGYFIMSGTRDLTNTEVDRKEALSAIDALAMSIVVSRLAALEGRKDLFMYGSEVNLRNFVKIKSYMDYNPEDKNFNKLLTIAMSFGTDLIPELDDNETYDKQFDEWMIEFQNIVKNNKESNENKLRIRDTDTMYFDYANQICRKEETE